MNRTRLTADVAERIEDNCKNCGYPEAPHRISKSLRQRAMEGSQVAEIRRKKCPGYEPGGAALKSIYGAMTHSAIFDEAKDSVVCECGQPWPCIGRINPPTIYGALCQYNSTVRPDTMITVERGLVKFHTVRGLSICYFVRVRTAGQITHEEPRSSELSARERFERIVELHVSGQPLNLS